MVPEDAGDPPLPQKRDDLVRRSAVPDDVPEAVGLLSPTSSSTASSASRFEWTSEMNASSPFRAHSVPSWSRQSLIYRTAGLRGRLDMGRKTTLMGFSLFGFVLGFLAWLLRNPVANLVASIGVNQDIRGAILAGIAGGFLMLMAVLVW